MSLYNLEYVNNVFENANKMVLNKNEKSYKLARASKEKELFGIKRKKNKEKEYQGQLYIFDLMGTLMEANFLLQPKSKEMGEKIIDEYYFMTIPYDERIKTIAEKFNELIKAGIETAIVTDYDHSEETWINTILYDIENALDDDCKNKVHYCAVGNGPAFLGKADRNDPLVKWQETKLDAYKKLIEQYPNHKLTFIDDRPHDDLPILLNDPKIKERSNIILINGYPTSIQSPHKSTLIDLNKIDELVENNDSFRNSLMFTPFCLKHSFRWAHLKETDFSKSVIKKIDGNKKCKQFFLDMFYLVNKCVPTQGYNVKRSDFYPKCINATDYDFKTFIKMYTHGKLEVAHFDDWWSLVRPQEKDNPLKKELKFYSNIYKEKE